MEESKPKSTAFLLGKLANNETVIGHEPLFPTSKANNGDKSTTEHKSGDSNEKGYGESNKTPDKGKTLSTQEKEERDMANMVMKGKFGLYCLLVFVKSVILLTQSSFSGHSKYEIFTGELYMQFTCHSVHL